MTMRRLVCEIDVVEHAERAPSFPHVREIEETGNHRHALGRGSRNFTIALVA